MYALIIPGLLPFVLLGTVMGLSWLEDHLLPPVPSSQSSEPSEPSEPFSEPKLVPVAPVPDLQLTSDLDVLTPVRAAR